MFPSPPPPHPVWSPGVSSLSHPFLAFPCLVPRQQNPQAIHTQLRCCMLETCCAAASPGSSPSVCMQFVFLPGQMCSQWSPPAQLPCPLQQIVPLKAECCSHRGVPQGFPGSPRKLLIHDGGAGRRGMWHFSMIRVILSPCPGAVPNPGCTSSWLGGNCPSHIRTHINLLLWHC